MTPKELVKGMKESAEKALAAERYPYTPLQKIVKLCNLLDMHIEWAKGLEFISYDGGLTEVCSICSEPMPDHKEHCPWKEIHAGTWDPEA